MEFIKNIKEYLVFGLIILSLFVLLNILCLTLMKIDESTIDKTKFCPNCGINLVELR